MIQKLKLAQDKRGYLQLDFLFASLIFFIFMFNIFYQIDSKYDEFDARFDDLEIKGYARDICYTLIQTPGYPSNWENQEVPNPQFLGLYNSTINGLDSDKISALKINLYKTILDKLELDAFLKIEIVGLESNTQYKEFGVSNSGSFSVNENYICYSNYNGEIVKVIVGLWK
jgi:hypothetical protein